MKKVLEKIFIKDGVLDLRLVASIISLTIGGNLLGRFIEHLKSLFISENTVSNTLKVACLSSSGIFLLMYFCF